MEVFLENNTEHMKSIKSVGKMQIVKAGVKGLMGELGGCPLLVMTHSNC